MHQESYNLTELALERYAGSGANVIDIGAYDVNGTLRPLIEEKGYLYTGLDVRPGPNVDVVSEHPECYPFADGAFDIVVTANALHNMARPWLVVPEMARILRPGGLLVIVTIYNHGINQHPHDYFRFTDYGLMSLFDWTGALVNYHMRIDGNGNTMGSAFKR